ncbi:MAG TPA: hypothetical protein VFZ28_02365 [Burkholderiaceae bacterium]|nr:hypothetical protein [Burkholderiaceae bacterium]
MNPIPSKVRDLHRPPDARWVMARAFLPKARGLALPALVLRLGPAVTPAADLQAYCALTDQRAGATLPLGWPQVWGFRLQMALLTDRRFPLPIWSSLQVRNRMLQHAQLAAAEAYAISVQPHALRRLDKGVEVDLYCALHGSSGQRVWESLTTFYWRGRGGTQPGEPSPRAASPVLEAAAAEAARWSSGHGAGWRFGALTGDYNGLHWSDRYANALGYAHAFHHPPRIAGQCLARLGIDAELPRQQLDLWIKGPVFYRSDLVLRRQHAGDAELFALQVGADPRPALVGRWAPADASTALEQADQASG